VPTPPPGGARPDYIERFAGEVIPKLQSLREAEIPPNNPPT